MKMKEKQDFLYLKKKQFADLIKKFPFVSK